MFWEPEIINIHKAIIEYAIARLFLIYFWPILFLNAQRSRPLKEGVMKRAIKWTSTDVDGR